MTIATISYTFDSPDYDGGAADVATLHNSIIGALDTHFPSWADAAAAWAAYRKIIEEIEGRGPDLLTAESLRLALEDSPAASAWASFLETAHDAGQGVYDCLPLGRTAGGGKQPFGFSIKFNPAADCGRDTKPPGAAVRPAAPGV